MRSGASLKDNDGGTDHPFRADAGPPVSTRACRGHCARPVAVTGRSSPPPEGRPPRPPHEFDAIYAVGTPAWDIGRPQPTFDHLATAGELVGRVLDVGCGTGEHALMAASLGFEAVGVDMSMRAIELAKTKAAERGVEARFVVADALRLVDLGEQFDTVLGCGLFHVLDDGERERYVASLAEVVPPGGRYHVLCFSDRQPGDWGHVGWRATRFGSRFPWDGKSNPSSPPSSISPGTPQEPGLAGSGHPQVEG